jgi:hypothetical protein
MSMFRSVSCLSNSSSFMWSKSFVASAKTSWRYSGSSSGSITSSSSGLKKSLKISSKFYPIGICGFNSSSDFLASSFLCFSIYCSKVKRPVSSSFFSVLLVDGSSSSLSIS